MNDLEIIILSEDKDKYYITYIRYLKNSTNELIYETETESQTEEKLMVTKGDCRGGGDKLGVWD